jgi:hypothetical protein
MGRRRTLPPGQPPSRPNVCFRPEAAAQAFELSGIGLNELLEVTGLTGRPINVSKI